MANAFAFRSLANSLTTWLTNSYQAARTATPTLPAFTFSVVTGSQLATEDGPDDNTAETNRVTLYLYRVAIDPHLRVSGRSNRPEMDPPPLSTHLHLLFSLWALNSGDEHFMLAWLMRALHEHPILDSSSLSLDAGWGPDEVVHLIPEELSIENMMRIWDALTPSYRVSLSYIARVVRIDPETAQRDAAPVVASRFHLVDQPQLSLP